MAACTTPYKTPFGRNQSRIGDMIIVESRARGIVPENLIAHIFEPYEPTTPTFSREFFSPLMKVHREAMRKFGRCFERIRCRDCGARKIPQALIGGRCEKCHDAYEKAHPVIPYTSSGPAYVYPDGWPEGRVMRG